MLYPAPYCSQADNGILAVMGSIWLWNPPHISTVIDFDCVFVCISASSPEIVGLAMGWYFVTVIMLRVYYHDSRLSSGLVKLFLNKKLSTSLSYVNSVGSRLKAVYMPFRSQ